ncbi:adenylate/guanylate cyclase domain-containing protein [Pseudodesulfovibrio sp. zrk46]|uniref:CHASE2 domain-containing protein n=1 Tax=Pseudodesulfovibrio sp. zrk46 TaxID=2725288 RepID=UPI001448F05E|nr:adenylate/guanylate cyclase domain-containing protein [Pseudodesulfovibrio sp. zrk46]QJB57638.1 CHASE2 domain-containing protein [Pseudodesulfovibrio sp. zrk46]
MLSFFKKAFKVDQLILLTVGIGASVLMAALFAIQPQFLRFLDNKLYDQYLSKYHSSNATDIPIIVDIDEKSLAEMGQWPWPRYRVAMLLKMLQAYGAASVATDIIFVEPDKTSPSILQKQWKKELKLDTKIEGLPESLRDNDKLLAHYLKTGPFVLGIDFLTQALSIEEGIAHQTRDCFIKPAKVAVLSVPGSPSPHDVLFKAEEAICPLPVLSMAAQRTGFITIAADEDSIYRKVPLLFSWNDKYYPSLALAALMQATGIKSVVVKMSTSGIESVRFGKIVIPTDHRGRMLINYRGPSKTFRYISASDILNKRLLPGELQGKIAFIGTSAAGLKDIRAMPLDPSYPGVEAHATIIDNIWSKDFISKPDWATGVEFIAMLSIGLATTFLLMWAKALWMIIPLIVASAGMWYGSTELYTEHKLYISPLYSYINLALTFLLLTMIKFWREEHAKKFIHGAFAHYLAPSVISQIMEDPDALSLEGQEKDITIQFSDVRSFTSLSEKLTPTQVTNLLHDYLTPMTRIITENQGTLDKFIGDAVMAFWNAPLDIENHQEKSLEAALLQIEKLGDLNEIFIEKYGFTIAVGLGIHSGSVRVGNMGSADLFDYTLIGDNVNLASRLEGLTKFYGQKLIVSQTIVDACEGKYYFRILDSVRVKGKVEPVTIYTSYRYDDAKKRQAELDKYEKAHELYLKKQFTEAKKLFEELDAIEMEPLLYKLYIERCDHLIDEHPGDDWDGVFTHKTK